jgi:hypothetical protein
MDVFGEKSEDNTALVLVNRSKDSKCQVSVNIGQWHKGIMYNLLEGSNSVDLSEGRLDIALEPLQGKLYVARP